MEYQPWYERLKRERLLRGWTQKEVADKLNCDEKNVSRWECGSVVPKHAYRQQLADLYEKNIEALDLINPRPNEAKKQTARSPWAQRPVAIAVATSLPSDHIIPSRIAGASTEIAGSRREDWGEAPSIDTFYGREDEVSMVESWIMTEHCRLVAILGIGGVGKTTFATRIARESKACFDVVFWRSLQNAPSVESLLANCLQLLLGQQHLQLPPDLEGQISLLISLLHQQRCLLILDNVESILQAEQRAGQYLDEFKGYARLFQRIGTSQHNSCLILTSREKPGEIALMEGRSSPVQSLTLTGVGQEDAQKLLQGKELQGSSAAWTSLIQTYAGNPLALKMISESIREIFAGDIASFLATEERVFGDVQDLLDQQFSRVSALERQVLYGLAVEREAVAHHQLQESMPPGSRARLFEAIESLMRRSLIEADNAGHFTLQPVIQEYVTAHFVEQVSQEIACERVGLLGSHALLKAQAADYIRESQMRFILAPIGERLLTTCEKADEKLRHLLTLLRTMPSQSSGYAAGNILHLLIWLRADLRGLDCSYLRVRQACLQDVPLPDVNFTGANLATSVFNDTFSTILCLTVSPNGTLVAGGTTTADVRVWKTNGTAGITPFFTCPGHNDGIRAVAFSPDSLLLASGSEDRSIRLWDCRQGNCLSVLVGHSSLVRSVAFSPDGKVLASASEDQALRLWDVQSGECLSVLEGHTAWIRAVAFSPDGTLLASGGDDQTIRLWDAGTGQCLKILQGHTAVVRTVSFHPDSYRLASGSDDQSIRVWDVQSGDCLATLSGHSELVRSMTISCDGSLLISGSDDTTIRLWSLSTYQCLRVLRGHTNRIWSVALTPDARMLLSTDDDEALRLWDPQRGCCLKTMQGRTFLIKALAFSPDGQHLISGSEDRILRLWDTGTTRCLHLLRGHANRIKAVAWSPDGAVIASSSEDETIRLWDASSGQSLALLQGHTHSVRCVTFNPAGTLLASSSYDQTIRLWDRYSKRCVKILKGHRNQVWSVAFSPDGTQIASSGEDRTLRLWRVDDGECYSILHGHEHRIYIIAWSPDGQTLASGSDDCTIRLWNVASGTCRTVLRGHDLWIRTLAFSPDGQTIVSGSHDQTVRVWDTDSGRCLKILRGHSDCVWSVTFHPDGRLAASCGDDGIIRLWNIRNGICVKTLCNEGPYERMNITGVLGLMEAQKIALKALGAIEGL